MTEQNVTIEGLCVLHTLLGSVDMKVGHWEGLHQESSVTAFRAISEGKEIGKDLGQGGKIFVVTRSNVSRTVMITLCGLTRTQLIVAMNETIVAVKRQIEMITKIPIVNQRLILCGKIVTDMESCLIGDYFLFHSLRRGNSIKSETPSFTLHVSSSSLPFVSPTPFSSSFSSSSSQSCKDEKELQHSTLTLCGPKKIPVKKTQSSSYRGLINKGEKKKISNYTVWHDALTSLIQSSLNEATTTATATATATATTALIIHAASSPIKTKEF